MSMRVLTHVVALLSHVWIGRPIPPILNIFVHIYAGSLVMLSSIPLKIPLNGVDIFHTTPIGRHTSLNSLQAMSDAVMKL